MTRTAAYVRISSDPEGRELGVSRQEDDCRELASRLGWEVVEVYSDNDISATGKKTRPAWERLMKDLESGEIDAVVAYSSSRLYRNLRDLQRLIGLADEGRVEIATVASGNVDLSTADGRMVARILASVDAAEAERITERVDREALDYAKAGKRRGGRRPFGYYPVPGGTLEIDPVESRAIRNGVDMVLQGAGPYAVARAWNESGVRTPSGSLWRTTRVTDVLTQGVIAGVREHRRDGKLLGSYDAVWPAIISTEELEVVRSLLRSDKHRERPSRKYPLSGILVCSECGQGMGGRTQPGGRRQYACPDQHMSIAGNATEDLVLDAVQERDRAYSRKRPLKQAAANRETALALARITEQRTALDRAAGLGADVTAPMERLDQEERALREGISPVLVKPTDDAERRARRHAGQLTEPEVIQTAEWVKSWVASVTVSPAANTRTPAGDRLEITWR